MRKKKIVIASILKPVDDPRSYKRFGLSMAKTNKYEINIIGNTTKINSEHPAIKFHPLKNSFGLSLNRLINRWRVIRKIITLRPDILILTTHEILLIAVLLKPILGYKLIYDIQENYLNNFWYQNNYATLIKYPLGALVRIKELTTSHFVNGFILAEEGYQKEFRFHLKRPHQILQNKPSINLKSPDKKRDWYMLIFTGNLSKNSGVFRAIELVEKLIEFEPRISLKIIGHCPDKSFRNDLDQRCKALPFVALQSEENTIPHDQIIAQHVFRNCIHIQTRHF